MVMINVLYLITTQEKSGPGNVLINILNNLDRENFTPIVAYMYQKKDAKENMYDFVSKDIRFVNLNMKSIFRGWLDFRVINKIKKVIKENNVDIIHMHLHRPIVFGAIAAKTIKRIATIHNQEPHQTPHNIFEFVVSILERIALEKCDKVTVVSKALKTSLLKNYGRLNAERIIAIYNAIDRKGYLEKEIQLRGNFNIGKEDVVIAAIGRLEEQKGLKYLIDALEVLRRRDIKNYKALIIGEGSLEEELKKDVKVKGLEGTVIFTGYIKEIESILNQIDVLVMPSLFEGLPMAMLEAMAHRVCCIGTDAGGVPELIGEDSIVVLKRSVDELAEALKSVITDKSLRSSIGNKLYQRFNNCFAIDHMMNDYQNLYLDVVNRKQ